MARTVKVSPEARAKAVRAAAGGGTIKLTAHQRRALARLASRDRGVDESGQPTSGVQPAVTYAIYGPFEKRAGATNKNFGN